MPSRHASQVSQRRPPSVPRRECSARPENNVLQNLRYESFQDARGQALASAYRGRSGRLSAAACNGWFALFQSLTNPVRMLPEIENPPDYDQVLLKRVVHSVGESP